MGAFDEEVDLALELITENGQPVTLRGFTPVASSDPDAPWKIDPSTKNDQPSVQAVFLDYNSRHVDGTVIMRGDQQVLVAHKGLTEAPQLSGQVLRGAEVWNIVNVETLSPNGQQILHTLQVRK